LKAKKSRIENPESSWSRETFGCLSKSVYFLALVKPRRGDQKISRGKVPWAELRGSACPSPRGSRSRTRGLRLYFTGAAKSGHRASRPGPEALHRLERVTGKGWGSRDPLLVSAVGRGALDAGMMERSSTSASTTRSVEGLAQNTSNPRFATDAYRRFIKMYGATAGIDRELYRR